MSTQTILRAGDIFAFCGRGWVSTTIQWRTWSDYSHIGLIVDIQARHLKMWLDSLEYNTDKITVERLKYLIKNPPGICLIESTMLTDLSCLITGKKIKGVQVHVPSSRVNSYNGDVYVMRPYQVASEEQVDNLAKLALGFVGTPYDGYGVARLGTFAYRHLTGWFATDRSSVFCSELTEFMLKSTGWGCYNVEPGESTPALVVDCHERNTHTEPQRVVL